MRWRVAVLCVGVSFSMEAQQSQPRTLPHAGGESSANLDEVRARPNRAYDRVRELLARASRSTSSGADTLIQQAHGLGERFALVWDDSFVVRSVDRFEGWSPAKRVAKVRADSLRRAGNAALGSQGIARAMVLWRRALGGATALSDTAGVAATLGNIGVGFYRASELDSAKSYLKEARRLADAIGDRRTALNATGALGVVAQEQHDLPQAYATYSRALELRRHVGDLRGAAADHTNLGLISAERGDLVGAAAHYETALTIGRENEMPEAAATALLNLGNLASTEGHFSLAASRYHEALGLYEAQQSAADVALVTHNLGLLALRRGDYLGAHRYLTDALRTFADVGTIEDLAQVHRDLASVAVGRGDLPAALRELKEAERLIGQRPERIDLSAAVTLTRADIAVELNTFDDADRQYVRAESSYRQVHDAIGESKARQGRAMLLLERGQFARAVEELELAERLTRTQGDRRANALAVLSLGYARLRQGDTASARRLLNGARDSLQLLSDPVSGAAALALLGDLELEAGSPSLAEKQYRRALSEVDEQSSPMNAWALRARLGTALRRRGALGAAATELERAIAGVERLGTRLRSHERRATFLADKWDAYAELALVEQQRGDAVAAFAVSERMRAREMLEAFARGRVELATRDSGLLQRQRDLRVRIAELTERLETEAGNGIPLRGAEASNNSLPATREALVKAQDEYGQLLVAIEDAGGAVAAIANPSTATWPEVASRLQKKQALLSYLVTDSTTLVFVATRDTIRALQLGVTRPALVNAIEFARGTIARPRGTVAVAPWRAPLRSLYTDLIAPLSHAGLLNGVEHLIIVPSAELNYLSFAALLGRNERLRDQFLIEKYDISYAPSASVWLRQVAQPRVQPSRVLALAPRSRELPGSRAEVEAIGAIYGATATVLTGEAATEESLASIGDYDVVHLATYGVLNQHNPLFSFVQLHRGSRADGRLEVHEVLGMNLHARLVVLSACQTALASGTIADVPPGDDWVGLVRAFLTAGAHNVVATLWPVDDRSTAVLMRRFHNYLHDGASEVGALSRVQREALHESAVSNPFFWAGFVLVGGR